MIHIDIPSRSEINALANVRSDAGVTIYLQTTPLSQFVGKDQIELKNLTEQAANQLSKKGVDKRRLNALIEHLEHLAEDDEFWQVQANSLAIFASPDGLRNFRLANELETTLQVSDRYHIKPLLRAVTFSHTAFILALSENAVRFVEISPGLPARSIKVENLPKSAAKAIGTANLNCRSASGRIQGSEGQNVRLRQYARRVDSALRPVLSGRHTPMILAATGRLGSLYQSVNNYPELLEQNISDSPDQMNDEDLATAARPILDHHYKKELDQLREQYEDSFGSGLASADVSDVARAATFGAVDLLMVNMEIALPGSVDDRTGAIELADGDGASTYDITDEISRRTLAHGGKVLAVRGGDLPAGEHLAAILRYRA